MTIEAGPKPILKTTSLHAVHKELGATMVDFGGWDMPVRYKRDGEKGGDVAENKAVRQAVGLFDVSHMGRVVVKGPDALQFVNHITTNDVGKLADWKGQYTLMCNPDGGIIDDLIVAKAGDEMRIVINAGNRDKDLKWFRQNAHNFDVDVAHVSDESALLALQGPRAVDVLARLTSDPISELLKPFSVVDTSVADVNMMVSRTGYTGENGFELWLPVQHAITIWKTLLEVGEEFGIQPCGLSARDTLRLEAGLSLYGHEINEETNPYEAGLGWVTKLGKDDFIGREALVRVQEQGVTRKIIGIRMHGRRLPTAGSKIVFQDEEVGIVVSGVYSPTLEIGIGTGFVPVELADQVSTEIQIAAPGKDIETALSANVSSPRFYKRSVA